MVLLPGTDLVLFQRSGAVFRGVENAAVSVADGDALTAGIAAMGNAGFPRFAEDFAK